MAAELPYHRVKGRFGSHHSYRVGAMIAVRGKYIVHSGDSDEDIIRHLKPFYDQLISNPFIVEPLMSLLNNVIQIDRNAAGRYNYNWSTSISDAQSLLAKAARIQASPTNITPGESAQDFVRSAEATLENLTAVTDEAFEGLLAKVIAARVEGLPLSGWSPPSGPWTPSLSKRVVEARADLRRARGLPPLIRDPRPPWPA